MLETRHHWLTVFLAIYLPVSFIISYIVAVEYDHVEPVFPYISYTGTISPESCVFAQLVNMGAVIGGIIVYIRYRHIDTHFMTVPGRKIVIRLNQVAFLTGMLTILGVSLVGNFQSLNVGSIHYIGAVLAFGVGFLYLILQTVISFMTVGEVAVPGCTVCIRVFRFILCILDALFLITLLAAMNVAQNKGPSDPEERLLWSSSDPGYTEHVLATSAEWLVAIVTVVYFASFHTEFKQFRMQPTQVKYYNPQALNECQHRETETPISVIG